MNRKLRILTNNVHTSYSCELARLGYDFFIEEDVWDSHLRPEKPENWKLLTDTEQKNGFDLILVNHDWRLASRYGRLYPAHPMIFSVLADCSEGKFPEGLENRASAVTFLGREVHDRWTFRNSLKKCVIELGLDAEPYVNGDRSLGGILTVGCNIGKRWDKGHCPYVTISEFHKVILAGPGNDGLPGSIGNVSQEKLLNLYATSQVYLNPGPIIGISMVEAMLSGLPIVTFRTINLCDLIQHGVNGFVVDTVDGAVLRLRELLEEPGLRMSMGAAAQETARERFSFERWARNWEYLFSSIVPR